MKNLLSSVLTYLCLCIISGTVAQTPQLNPPSNLQKVARCEIKYIAQNNIVKIGWMHGFIFNNKYFITCRHGFIGKKKIISVRVCYNLIINHTLVNSRIQSVLT